MASSMPCERKAIKILVIERFFGRPEVSSPPQRTEGTSCELLQLGILGFGLLQEGNIMVSVFPERQEVLICGTGFDRVALHSVSASEAETGQRSPGEVHHHSPVVDELLKLRSRCVAVVQHEIGFSPQINRA